MKQGTPEAELNTQAFVAEVADLVCRLGLRAPALIALDAGRPLAFIGGQLLWVAQPTLALFGGQQKVAELAQLLEEPAAVEALITQLETREP